jgi:hypothetical protein
MNHQVAILLDIYGGGGEDSALELGLNRSR